MVLIHKKQVKMNLFLIESPFQLINAIEALNCYEDTYENSMFLCLNIYGEKNRNQINKVVEEFGITNYVILVDLDVKNKYNELKLINRISLTIKKLVDKNGTIKSIFIGDLRSYYFTLILNNLRTKAKIIALDDGNANIQIIKKINEKRTPEIGNNSNRIKKSLYTIMGYSSKPIEPDEFFTYYYDLFPDPINVKLVKNSFNILSSRLSRKTVGNFCYFLGNKISEVGIVSEAKYLERLKLAFTYIQLSSKISKIYYIPHRGEDHTKISKLKNLVNVEILNAEMPFELFLVFAEELPLSINSFFSSALDSAKRLLASEIEINAFYVPSSEISKSSEIEKINMNYESYKNSDISVIKSY